MERVERVVAAGLALACLLAVATAPVAAVHQEGSAFVVLLEADGDATVELQQTYNLTEERKRERFGALQENETARRERVEAFAARLERGATTVRESTDRDPQVGEVRLNVTERDAQTGVVNVSAPVTDLAAVEGRAVVLTQPFSGGFEVNTTLVVHGPDGYVRGALRPLPDRARRNSASWGAESDLSGFAARFEKPPTPTPRPEGWGAFTGAAVLALIPALAVVVFASRRR